MARPAKLTDTEILDRAMHQVWRRGWAASSVRDLEIALDMKAPSIYRRFGSKVGLGAAVVDHYVATVVEGRIAKHLDPDRSPVDNLSAFLERAVTQARHGDDLVGCLLTTTSLSGDLDIELQRAVDRGLARIEQAIGAEVDRAHALGLLRPGVDADAATASLVLAMQGLMALARGTASPKVLQRRARAAVHVLTG